MTPRSIYALFMAVLGLFLAIPSNICIAIVNLESLRKKVKLSPPDKIFMAKGMVNILLQGFLSLQGVLSVFSPEVFYIPAVYTVFHISKHFFMYFSFWMTVWLSAHYCTNITNLSSGFFIWMKRIVSNYLSHVLFLTALVLLAVCFPYIWTLIFGNTEFYKNSSVTASDTKRFYHPHEFHLVPATSLGVILPFCLSLLCLLLTFSFLVRHVWRVKNNDSGCSRPNLQAHVTALRTIFLLLLIFTSFIMSEVISVITKPTKNEEKMAIVVWTLLSFSPSAEAAVILQASRKLRRILVRRFWSRSLGDTET